MVVIRYLAGVTLVSALVAGCAQSLFDANPGDDEDSDGRPPDLVDAGRPDARDGEDPDAAVPLVCPVPDCVGDAVGQFATDQDGPWRYVEVQAGALGFLEMSYDDERDPPRWTGEDLNPSFIVNCDQHTDASGCNGLDNRILLQPSVDFAAPRPALAWTAPETGTYRLSIDWRLDDTQTSVKPAAVLVARNSQSDRVAAAQFDASIEPGTFEETGGVEIDAVKGDSIALALDGDMPSALGVSFYVSDLERNDRCQMAFSLEGSSPFQNACAGDGAVFRDIGSQATVAVEPPGGIPGVARTFLPNSSLQYQGDVNDYSGDWTLQFWAKLDAAGQVLSDLSCTDDGAGNVVTAGGVSVRFDGDAVYISAANELLTESCTSQPAEVSISSQNGFSPGQWHFYRIVRNRDLAIHVCFDGGAVDVLDVPNTATMTTDRKLTLGKPAGNSPTPSFLGLLADLRLYDRALPCRPGL